MATDPDQVRIRTTELKMGRPVIPARFRVAPLIGRHSQAHFTAKLRSHEIERCDKIRAGQGNRGGASGTRAVPWAELSCPFRAECAGAVADALGSYAGATSVLAEII